nr:DUF4350 domain-containing protein [Mycolicibacterium palauense]
MWIAAGAALIASVALLTAWLTAPKPGGRMDPGATSPHGAHALTALLRGRGVDVVVADTVDEAEREATAGSLLLVAQSYYTADEDLLSRLADTPADLLLVEPTTRTRAALTPRLRLDPTGTLGGEPGCDLRAATRAGTVYFGPTDTYRGADGLDLTRCYDGALVRFHDGDRTVTVVGTAEFMTNSGLLSDGNAALAMNLAGERPRLVWYAPQRQQGEKNSAATPFDLLPKQVDWVVWQLCLVVALLALWKVRRLGPLVAESLPVVVRASETVEGRGRLYRSRRARDRAAHALRTAALQRLLPRLGLGADPDPRAVVATAAARSGIGPDVVHGALFGPAPQTDTDLVHLANTLDDIERQVAHS